MPKKFCGCYYNLLDDRYGASPRCYWTSGYIDVETSEKLQRGFTVIRMRSYILEEQLQLQTRGASFCIFLLSNN